MGVIESIKDRFGWDGGDKAPNNERAVVSLVDDLYSETDRTLMSSLYLQWFVSIAMRSGLQYIDIDPKFGRINIPDSDRDRVRMIVNRMQASHMTKVGKLAMDNPVWSVTPEVNEEDAKDVARSDEALLRDLFNNEDVETDRLLFLGWAVDTGNVFWKIVWDKDLGDEITDLEGNGVREGDVRLIMVPPYEIIGDPSAKDGVLRGDWVMHAHEETLENIRAEWPEHGERVKAETDNSQRVFYYKRVTNIIGNIGDIYGHGEKDKGKKAILKELYYRPDAKNPQGRYIVVANGIWLNPTENGKVGPLPYPHLYSDRRFADEPVPFVQMRDLPISGSPWARGTMQDQVPIQKGYNRTWSQTIENANYFGNLKLLSPRGAKISTEAYDDSGNEVIEYTPGFGEPHFMAPASLPAHVMSLFELYPREFMAVSGMYEVTSGQRPQGVNSGVALAQLQQSDDVRMQPTQVFYRSCLKKAGEHALALYREFMVDGEERQVKVSGEEGFESVTVVREKMGDKAPLVRVKLQSDTAWERELKRQQVQNAYEKGLFGNPQDPQVRKTVLGALEYGDLQKFFEDSEMDEKNAKRNIEDIEQGNLVQVGMTEGPVGPMGISQQLPKLGLPAENWEDHATHIRIYNNFRKSLKWRQWPPDKKRILNDLAEAHAKMLVPPPEPVQPKINLSVNAKALPEQVAELANLPKPSPATLPGIGGPMGEPPATPGGIGPMPATPGLPGIGDGG